MESSKLYPFQGMKAISTLRPKSQLTQVGGWDRLPAHHRLTPRRISQLHERSLVDGCVLVGALVLGQVVDINTWFTVDIFIIVGTHHDSGCIH